METRGRTKKKSASPFSKACKKLLIVKKNLQIAKLALLVSGVLLVGAASRVDATSIPWGDPVLGHSWDQLWVETSDVDINRIVARIVAPPATSFEPPGFFGFSVASWVVDSMTDREIRAHGTDTGRLEFNTHFNGLPTDYSPESPLVLDFFFLQDNTFVEGHRWTWDGSIWIDPDEANPGDLAVPDGGATLLLLGCSALALSWFRRRLA